MPRKALCRADCRRGGSATALAVSRPSAGRSAPSGRRVEQADRPRARTPPGRWLLRLPSARTGGPIEGRGRRPQLMEKFVIEGGVAAVRHDGPGRQQERRAADPRLERPHRGRGDRAQRAAHPRRRGDARDPRARSASRSPGAAPTRSRCAPPACTASQIEPRARRADPRLVPARRPAARALPPRRDAAARRRRDRPPPARPAPRRVPRDGRQRRVRTRHRAQRAARPAVRPTCSWTSRR